MKQLLIDLGCSTLEVEVSENADLDGAFRARCLDTGEILIINGWTIDNVEEI